MKNKKILLVLTIAIATIWSLFFPTKPTIEILNPKDGITISVGDKVDFKIKINGHFTYGDSVKFVNENNPQDSDHLYWYPQTQSRENVSLYFYKEGTYKIVATGSDIEGWGSKIVAQSNPVTVNVKGIPGWRTIVVKELPFTFLIQVPGEWSSMIYYTQGNFADPQKVKMVNFEFNNGVTVFTVVVFPKEAWNDNLLDSQMKILTKTLDYVFVASLSDEILLSNYPITNQQVQETLPRIFQSFRIK